MLLARIVSRSCIITGVVTASKLSQSDTVLAHDPLKRSFIWWVGPS